MVSEYSYVLGDEVDLEELLEKMTSLLHRKFQDPATYSWVVSAITKMVVQLGRMSDIVHSQLILHLSSTHIDIQQVWCPSHFYECGHITWVCII